MANILSIAGNIEIMLYFRAMLSLPAYMVTDLGLTTTHTFLYRRVVIDDFAFLEQFGITIKMVKGVVEQWTK